MTNRLPVTLVTKDAGRPEDDEVFMRELRYIRGDHKPQNQRLSVAQVLKVLGEPANRKAFWAHRLADPPTRTTFPPEARDAIRRAVGEAPPPTVTEVTSSMIDERAAMWLIGELAPGNKVDRVLMLAVDSAVEIHVNGTIHAEPFCGDLRPFDGGLDTSTSPAKVTPVTPPVSISGQSEGAVGRKYKPYFRPCLSKELEERIKASGRSVEELIEAGLNA